MKREIKINGKSYKEVRIDNTSGFDGRHYRHPMTKVFQYEYALFLTVSDLFSEVSYRSMCIDRLELYFKELPHAAKITDNEDDEEENLIDYRTQEGYIATIKALVERDITGKIISPMIQACRAELLVGLKEDGSHTFTFTDGIYGFTVCLLMSPKGRPIRIRVRNLSTSS